MTEDLRARLQRLNIGHQVEFVAGAAAEGVIVRGPYADPVTVVEHAGNYQLVASDAAGQTKVIDTEISATASTELVALYLAFHSLWAMKRLVDRHGPEAVARTMPQLSTHQQLVIAFIAGSIASSDQNAASYAQGLLQNATTMLQEA